MVKNRAGLRLLFFAIVSVIFLLLISSKTYAAPADPFPFDYTQADGTVITIQNHGDEFFSWTGDMQGSVIEFDVVSSNWCYAYISDDYRALPGPHIVGEETQNSEDVPKITVQDIVWAKERRMEYLEQYPLPGNVVMTTYTQPDGTMINVNKLGDEFISWTEDQRHYVIEFDEENSSWCYAYISDSNEILPGPHAVGKETYKSKDIPKITRDDIRKSGVYKQYREALKKSRITKTVAAILPLVFVGGVCSFLYWRKAQRPKQSD